MKPVFLCVVLSLAAACLPATAPAAGLADFALTPNAAIPGFNRQQLGNVTPQDCAVACQGTYASWCTSFDYYKQARKCDLSDKRAGGVGGLKTNYAGNPYDHYALGTNALPAYSRTNNAAIEGYNVEHLYNVSAEDCAAACSNPSRAAWCVSFDYHKYNWQCELSDKRANGVGGLKTNYSGHPYDHYSLRSNALPAYTRVANAAIDGHNVQHLEGVSPEDCASACSSPSRIGWCKSFDYYTGSRKCDLSDKNAADVGGLRGNYWGYDHYFVAQREGIPNPVPGKKHVLFIGLDGLRGDALFCNNCAVTPAMTALANGGAFHRNVLAGGVQPTVSGPGWATTFTGFWANEHGINSNNSGLRMRRTHVFDLLKAAYPTATVGVVGDWYNITQNLKPISADFVVANRDKDSQQATDTVKGWLKWKHAPTAIFYYLHNVDIHTNSYAPLNTYYQSKIRAEDAQIQQVLDALAARPTYAEEEWLIVVTSDHGGHGSSHGGQSAGERSTPLILNNSYRNPTKLRYCVGDLTGTPMLQIDGSAPHILDFFGLPNVTAGRKHPACGRS